MTEAEIHADPHRILALADELGSFITNLRTELEKMGSGIHELGGTWRDQEYEKFKTLFNRVQQGLEELQQEVSRREPELREDAALLVQYLNTSAT